MADEAKEYVRAAQQAELEGDKPRAIELLMKAAVIFRETGNPSRAIKMLRNARLLDGKRQDLIDQLRPLEWIPDDALARAVSGEDETQQALEALDQAAHAEVPGGQLVERGPCRADPTLAAWCSFCCKPRAEVGGLVAGPAGAFICRGCVLEARRILGTSGETEPAARSVAKEPDTAAAEPIGQQSALQLLDAAFRLNVRLVLLLGGEGTGKSMVLGALAQRGLGRRIEAVSELSSTWDGQRVLFDPATISEEESQKLLVFLSQGEDRQLVVALRGEAPAPAFMVKADGVELPVHGAGELTKALAGRLPSALAEQIQLVVQLVPLEAPALVEIAKRLLASRAAALELSDEVVTTIAQEAARSGRGGAELESLISRLPPGSWGLAVDANKKGKPVRRKKASAGEP